MYMIIAAVTVLAVCGIGYLVQSALDSGVSNVKAQKVIGNIQLPSEQQIWFDKGIEELKAALSMKINKRHARNVILFVGDGMGPNTVTAARIYGFKEEGLLSWEKFPHMGLLKTYCADKQVPDSFSTATALFGGVKVNYETGGVDASVPLKDCSASLNDHHHVGSIIKWAQADGMMTGFVTTTRVTHATPAALYAHSADRRWECEATMPKDALDAGCKDIARQLVEDETGRRINVIMGGGRQMMISNSEERENDPIDTWSCKSQDGRDLIKLWQDQKKEAGKKYAVVQDKDELRKLDGSKVDYVLGIFANGHLLFNYSKGNMPSLTAMTLKALDVLKTKKRNKGFLLVVEGGLIDQAHHRGRARVAISETLELNEAVKATMKKMSDKKEETLVIVTADHSHTLTINGYPKRGNDILGVAGNSKTEQTPYTTLTYGTSYKGFQVDAEGKRKDPSNDDIASWDYTPQAAINTDENYHGGSDVTVHATGAMSYLFHGVHEQSYVAYVISYALRIGRLHDFVFPEKRG